MTRVIVENRDDYVIEDDEVVVRVEGVDLAELPALLKKAKLDEKMEEVDDFLYLIKTVDLAAVQKLEEVSPLSKNEKSAKPAATKEKITTPAPASKGDKKPVKNEADISPLEKILQAISPTEEEFLAAGVTPQDVNENNENVSFEECIKFVRVAYRITKEKYEKLSSEERAIIDAPCMPDFDMKASRYCGITDEGMKALYDEAWNRVSKEEELYRYRQPDLILHEWGLYHISENALAAYDLAQHCVVVGKLLWKNYGNVELIEKERQEIIDIFVHEFAHIVNLNHGKNFWKLTGKNDSVGKQIREYREKNLAELKKKLQARK